MERDFGRQQIILAERARTAAFPRTISIIAFTGVLLICLTLSKIPKIEGGYPLLLNHEILFSFGLCSVFAILLNLFILLLNLLSRLNGRKLDKAATAAPASGVVEIMEKCLANQKKIMDALELGDKWIYIWGWVFWVYAFEVALFGYFFPYRDVSSNYGNICSPFVQMAMPLTILLKLMVDGFPKHWEETD